MKIVHEFTVKDHERKQIDLTHLIPIIDAHIIELHHNENGSSANKPTFAFVGQIIGQGFTVGQITLASLNHALNKLGYEINEI